MRPGPEPERAAAARALAIVKSVTHYQDPATLLEVSFNLGDPMKGLEIGTIPENERLQERGW